MAAVRGGERMKLNELYKFVKNGVLKTEILKYFSSVQIIEIMKSDHRPGDALSRILFDKDGMECIKNHYEYYIAVKFSQKIENEILTAFLNDNYSLLNWGDYYINVYGKDLAGFYRCFVFNGTED